MKWTVENVVVQAARELTDVTPSPQLDAEVLLADLLGQDRTWLVSHPHTRLPVTVVRAYARRLVQRQSGQPVAYITGWKDFYSLRLKVNPAVLIPRPTTELLVQAVLQHELSKDDVIADIGTGSGAIALALASQLPRQMIIATDISIPALQTAAANARYLRMPGRIDWRHGSLLDPVEHQPLAVIISNLPYLIPEQERQPELQAEPAQALIGGSNGWLFLNRLLAQAAERHDWHGLILECTPLQSHQLRAAAIARWPDAKILPLTDGQAVRGLAIWRHAANTKPSGPSAKPKSKSVRG